MPSDFSFTSDIFLIRKDSISSEVFKLSFAFIYAGFESLALEKNFLLTPTELRQLKSFHPKRQLSFMLGRKAYSLLISPFGVFPKEEKFQILYGIFGNPFIKHPNFDISLSHASYCSVASLFSRELLVGVDIEYIDEKYQETLYQQITESERSFFCSRGLKFYTPFQESVALWTMKESISKALKCGLSIPYPLLETEKIIEQDNFLYSTFKHFPQFQCLTWVSNSFAFSVAFPINLKINNSHEFCSKIRGFLLKADEAHIINGDVYKL